MKEITNKKEASKYLNISEKEIFDFWKSLNRSSWAYSDSKGHFHLFKEADDEYIELTKNVEAIKAGFLIDDGWRYQNIKGHWHRFDKNNKLIRDMKDTVKITTKTQAAKFLKVSKEEISDFYEYSNESWRYRDVENYYHLFGKINGNWIELTKNIKAIYVFKHNNDNWSYTDVKGYEHLFRRSNNQWIELTKGIIATYVLPYDNGDWKYRDENDNEHLFRKIDDKYIELTKNIETICAISYNDKSWSYLDKEGKEIFVSNETKIINSKKKAIQEVTNEKQAAEYLNIPENEISGFIKYLNKDWAYVDEKEYWHLFRKIDGKYVELTENVNAVDCFSYLNGDWKYTDENKNNIIIKK